MTADAVGRVVVVAQGRLQLVQGHAGMQRLAQARQAREAVRMQAHVAVRLRARTVEEVVDELLKAKAGAKRSEVHLKDLESRLTLTRSQAAAIIQYRTKKGSFKSIEDLKKVPGVDAAKIEAKKDRLVF